MWYSCQTLLGQNAYKPHLFLGDLIRRNKFISQISTPGFLQSKYPKPWETFDSGLLLTASQWPIPHNESVTCLRMFTVSSAGWRSCLSGPLGPALPPLWLILQHFYHLLSWKAQDHPRSFIHWLFIPGTYVTKLSP